MVFSQHYFPFRRTLLFSKKDIFQCSLQTFQTDWVKSSNQSSRVIQNSCYINYPVFCHPCCTSVISHLSSLTMIYFILGFKLFSPTFLVEISANFRPPSHQSILWILHFYPFLTKFILLENMTCVLGILTILSHTHSRLTIQYT